MQDGMWCDFLSLLSVWSSFLTLEEKVGLFSWDRQRSDEKKRSVYRNEGSEKKNGCRAYVILETHPTHPDD